MKKVILTALVCSFIASPVFANEFVVEQANILSKIATKMESVQDDSASIDYLTQKKSCVEAAANMGELKDCIVKFPAPTLKAVTTATN